MRTRSLLPALVASAIAAGGLSLLAAPGAATVIHAARPDLGVTGTR
ncbi:hypothetical protein ACLB9X_00905 [Streptomyces sp. 5K101]